MQTNETTSHAWYSLRRTLVEWNFDESLDDLLALCKKAKLDEIILKCDTEEFSHGFPSIEWLQSYQPKLVRARDALHAIGVVYSLNPWVTQGHCDRGRDVRDRFPDMRFMAGHDGTTAKAQACPLCPVWRKHTQALWTLYAETHPHVLWVEDDIRTFNHRPISVGCFCDEHMRRFSERAGKSVTREALVAALLQAGTPHPWRALWLQLQGDVMIDTVRFLETTVHAASPETRLGLMSSGPESHVIEGRRWQEFAEALGGATPLYSRPPLGNYSENSLRGLYYTSREIKSTRHCLPTTAVEQTEVENWPFTQYSKSVTFTKLQIATCLALGADGLTMNLYDHLGTPTADDTTMHVMLAEEKPFFNAISERCRGKAPCGGIQLLHRDTFAAAKHVTWGGSPVALAEDSLGWDEPLQAMGYATTFDAAPIVALTGQMARALTNNELDEVLSKGVLLDADAAQVLLECGRGAEIGIESIDPIQRNDWPSLAAEEWHHPDFGGAPNRFMTMTLPNLGGDIRIDRTAYMPDAIILSRLVNADRKELAPCIGLFENARGGRVATVPVSINSGWLPFANPIRKQQFQHILDYLGKGTLPLEITSHDGAYPLPIIRRFDTHTVIGALNLSLDLWTGITFDLHEERMPRKIEKLSPDGVWEDQPLTLCTKNSARITISLKDTIPFDAPLLMDLLWE